MKPPFDLEQAERTLSKADEQLARLIETFGPCAWTLRSMESPYQALLRAIVYQQLSTASANAIFGRVEALFPEGEITPEAVLAMPEDSLRECGVSRPKIRYMKDLAQKTIDHVIPSLDEMTQLDDEEILERLCAVKGIGRWTVEMLLMFNLGRPDVLPSTDLVIRRGFKNIYDWKELPSIKELEKFGEVWRPYRSVASWYIWRFEDGDNSAW